MNTRIPTVVAAVSIAAVLGWLLYGTSEQPAAVASASATAAEVSLQQRSSGSEVPCAVPLAWRIARVDPEFGVTASEAATIVGEAGRLWEDGTGRRLFVHEPEEGFPVRLVYDERQEELNVRGMRQRELDALARRLAAEAEELVARGERVDEARADYVRRATELERRVAAHNATVAEWNRRGGVTPERRAELAAVEEELRAEEAVLASERATLEAAQRSLSATEADLNARILEHQRLSEEFTTEFPTSEVQAGEYREAVTRIDGRVDSVSREIRLYRFEGGAELRLLAAHELGHALGLGHTQDAAGVMHASSSPDRPVQELAVSDIDLLLATCPATDDAR